MSIVLNQYLHQRLLCTNLFVYGGFCYVYNNQIIRSQECTVKYSSTSFLVYYALIVISVYSLEVVEKNVTLLYTLQRSVSPQDTCKIFVKF